MNGDAYEWWECHYTAPAAGLYFYEFYVDTWHGCLRLGRGFNGADVIDPKAPRWQLTVYEKGFTTPDWLARRRDVSDLPGPLLLLRPPEAACAGRPHAAPGLGRRALVEAEREGRGHELRLFRRRSARHRAEAAVSQEPRRDVPLSEPHLRGPLQPPLQHGELCPHRSAPRHGGGLPLALRQREEARHPHPARRRVQPHGQRQRLFQPRGPLSRPGRIPVEGFAVLPVVFLPQMAGRLRELGGAL